MGKIVIIGECGLDVVYNGSQPCGSMPAGRLLNAAMMLARTGRHVVMAGDTGADALGSIVVDALAAAGAETSSVDRYVDGQTPVYFYTQNGVVAYRIPSHDGGFDIVWPRVDPEDVVVFGGYYAIDPLIHQRVSALVAHAVERKAFVVYLPGFLPQLAPRLTRVMPAIIENLEMSSLIVTRPADCMAIYGETDPLTSYRDHLSYYTPLMVDIDAATGGVRFFSPGETALVSTCPGVSSSLLWGSAAAAAVIDAAFRAVSDQSTDSLSEKIKSNLSELNAQIKRFMPVDVPAWMLAH